MPDIAVIGMLPLEVVEPDIGFTVVTPCMDAGAIAFIGIFPPGLAGEFLGCNLEIAVRVFLLSLRDEGNGFVVSRTRATG